MLQFVLLVLVVEREERELLADLPPVVDNLSLTLALAAASIDESKLRRPPVPWITGSSPDSSTGHLATLQHLIVEITGSVTLEWRQLYEGCCHDDSIRRLRYIRNVRIPRENGMGLLDLRMTTTVPSSRAGPQEAKIAIGDGGTDEVGPPPHARPALSTLPSSRGPPDHGPMGDDFVHQRMVELDVESILEARIDVVILWVYTGRRVNLPVYLLMPATAHDPVLPAAGTEVPAVGLPHGRCDRAEDEVEARELPSRRDGQGRAARPKSSGTSTTHAAAVVPVRFTPVVEQSSGSVEGVP